jgi:phosphatidylserine decarboxylase
VEEAEKPLSEYPSLAAFFSRSLKAGARPIDASSVMVSPVDGCVKVTGKVTPKEASGSEEGQEEPIVDDVRIQQVKGVEYSLKALLMEKGHWNLPLDRSLFYVVFYLAPGDYHGFHAPADCQFNMRKHIYGQLLPVWHAFSRNVPGLFALNERVVLDGIWSYGKMAYVAVGATNVGSIRLVSDPLLRTNVRRRHRRSAIHPDHEPAQEDIRWSRGEVTNVEELDHVDRAPLDATVARGDVLGFFHLGSTVVMVFEAPHSFQFTICDGDTVRIGQSIATLPLSPDLIPEAMKTPYLPASACAGR